MKKLSLIGLISVLLSTPVFASSKFAGSSRTATGNGNNNRNVNYRSKYFEIKKQFDILQASAGNAGLVIDPNIALIASLRADLAKTKRKIAAQDMQLNALHQAVTSPSSNSLKACLAKYEAINFKYNGVLKLSKNCNQDKAKLEEIAKLSFEKYDGLKEKYVSLQQMYKALEEKLAIVSSSKELEAENSKLKANLAELNKSYEVVKSELAKCKKDSGNEEEIKELKGKISKAEEVYSTLQNDYAVLNKQYEQSQKDLSSCSAGSGEEKKGSEKS